MNIFEQLQQSQGGELHFVHDPKSKLRAIIAIHNTRLGPAIGGCRCQSYDSEQAAIVDAIRLAKSMSYKAALANLPQGGGKAVIWQSAAGCDGNRADCFAALGSFIEQLNGRYWTAIDSGTSAKDMDVIAQHTNYVLSNSHRGGDPSPHTAIGVLQGIRAAIQFVQGKQDLKDVHVAIQGVGQVGTALAELLYQAGAQLTVADINQQRLAQLAQQIPVQIVSCEEIFTVPCDVLAPCGFGGVLNQQTIPQLQCSIIAGAANNQLKCATSDSKLLFNRGIVYVPDYVINAGGLIQVSLCWQQQNKSLTMDFPATLENKLLSIFETVQAILIRAEQQRCSPQQVADSQVAAILYQ